MMALLTSMVTNSAPNYLVCSILGTGLLFLLNLPLGNHRSCHSYLHAMLYIHIEVLIGGL